MNQQPTFKQVQEVARELFQERAAIMEYEAGMFRAEAQIQALKDVEATLRRRFPESKPGNIEKLIQSINPEEP